jgi:hypothetical protein
VVPKVIERRGARSRVAGQSPSTVDVAAPARAVCLRPELALQLHQAQGPGAVRTDVGRPSVQVAALAALDQLLQLLGDGGVPLGH